MSEHLRKFGLCTLVCSFNCIYLLFTIAASLLSVGTAWKVFSHVRLNDYALFLRRSDPYAEHI